MGRLGSTPADGCAPLGEHLLGAWVIFDDGLGLGDAPGKTPGVGAADGIALSDGRVSAIGQGLADRLSISETRAMAATMALTGGLDVGDTLARAWAAVRAVSDGVRLSDSKLLGQMLLGEPLDQPDMVLTIGKNPQAGILLQDAIVHAWDVIRGYDDGVDLREAAGKVVGHAVDDALSLSDAEALLLALALTLRARSGGLSLDPR